MYREVSIEGWVVLRWGQWATPKIYSHSRMVWWGDLRVV
jgi:hypothetical protein